MNYTSFGVTSILQAEKRNYCIIRISFDNYLQCDIDVLFGGIGGMAGILRGGSLKGGIGGGSVEKENQFNYNCSFNSG